MELLEIYTVPARLLLAVAFGYASVRKIFNFQDVVDQLLGIQVRRQAGRWSAAALMAMLCGYELMLGASLIAGVQPQVVALCVIGTMVIFSCYIAVAEYTEGQSCNCFGLGAGHNILISFVRNAILLMAGVVLLSLGGESEASVGTPLWLLSPLSIGVGVISTGALSIMYALVASAGAAQILTWRQ